MSFSTAKKVQIFDAASVSSGFDEDGASSSKTTINKHGNDQHNSSLNYGNIQMLNERIALLSLDRKQEIKRPNSSTNAGNKHCMKNEQVLASIDDDKHENKQGDTTSNACKKLLDKTERVTIKKKEESERHDSSSNDGNKLCMKNERIATLSLGSKQENKRLKSTSNAGNKERHPSSIDDKHDATSDVDETHYAKNERVASSSSIKKKEESERLTSSSNSGNKLCIKNEQIASSSDVDEDDASSSTESIQESNESNENVKTELFASPIDDKEHGNEQGDTTSNVCEKLLHKNERPTSSLILDNKHENKQSPNVDKNICVENQRILVTFRHELEAKNDHNSAVTSFTRRHICNGRNPSKQNYSDVPEHWKYLQNTVPLNFSSILNLVTEVIIVEKYADLAIGYNHILTNRPIAIFRDCFDHFNNLKLGDVVRVSLFKIYIHVDQPTIIFTDFHAIRSELTSYNFHQYESSLENGLVKLSNFTFQVKEITRINQYRVLYCDFGGIIVPKKLCKILTMEAFSKSTIVGSVKYRLTCLSETQCACWKLGHDFDIYQDGIVHARVLGSKLEMVKDQIRRLNLNTGQKNVRMVVPSVEKKKYSPKYKCKWTFMKQQHGFKFAPGKRRTNVHKS